MEAEVSVRCRKSDEKIVLEVVDEAIEEYKKIMKQEVKAFKDREVPAKINLDRSKFLPEYD